MGKSKRTNMQGLLLFVSFVIFTGIGAFVTIPLWNYIDRLFIAWGIVICAGYSAYLFSGMPGRSLIMWVKFGYPMDWPGGAKIVVHDTLHTERSFKDFGNWFKGQIYHMPSLFIIGTKISDGISMYEIVDLKGPRYEVGENYRQRFAVYSQNESTITIITRFWLPFVGFLYLFFKGPERDGDFYFRTEKGVLEFLTRPD